MTSLFSASTKNSGFTLVELLMVVVLVAVLSVATVDVFTDTLNESRFQTTLARMRQIQNAMIGDPAITDSNVRTSFGFLGDVGAIPTAAQGIAALVAQPFPALPAYAINAATRIALGWNGPYLSGGNSGVSYTTDAWNNTITYNAASSPPTIVSLGSDGIAGGTGYATDITLSLSNELRLSTVQGFICSRGGPFKLAAQVELNFPNGAAVLTQSLVSVTIANAGQFLFPNVPLGVRSLSVYIPTKAAPTTTLGPVVFTIDKPNYLVPCNAIDVNP